MNTYITGIKGYACNIWVKKERVILEDEEKEFEKTIQMILSGLME